MELLKNNKKNSNAATLKWIFKRCKKYFPIIGIISVLAGVSAISYVALALLSKDVLDIATGSQNGNLSGCAVALLAVVMLQIILIAADYLLDAFVSGKLTISLRNHLFSKISRKKYAESICYHSGDLLNRLTSDVEVVVNNVVNIIPNVVSMVSKIIGGIAALIVLDKRIALIILALGISVPAIGRLINRRFKALHKRCQETEGRTRSFMQECFENLVVMKTFESQGPFFKKLNQYMRDNYRIKMKRSGISVITHLGLYGFFTVGYYAVLVWGADSISKGMITYGTLMAFLQLVDQLRAPLQNISGIVPQYYSALASAERLIEIDSGDEDKPAISKKELDKIKNSFSGIKLENVTFAYKDELILENCSFVAEPEKITAVTGESGSGKSTVFKILLGLYEPQAGRIVVNGDTLLDTSLRGLFAYVPQGNMVLSGTIRDNITLCDDSISDEAVINAAKAAEIYDIIKEMPDGFDTELSERGGGLSEGQIQRISIARAILTDAPVLLLDEATSALDEETETKVLSNIKSLSGKTVLFVTHRNTSLKVCDRIIHVQDKRFTVIKE